MRMIYFIRSFIVTLVYPVIVVSFALPVLFLGPIRGSRPLQDWIIGAWAWLSLKFFGVSLEVKGFENLPAGGYIALFNHTSNFDILAIQSVIPRIRFGAKIELFRIPIFGHAMRASKALPIARSQRKEVMKVYEEAQGRIAEGECFALSPEGSRQEDEVLAPFKAGPFIFAIESQAPLVPIAIMGAQRIQPKGALFPNCDQWNSTIRIVIGEPILTEGFTSDQKSNLQEALRQRFHELGIN